MGRLLIVLLLALAAVIVILVVTGYNVLKVVQAISAFFLVGLCSAIIYSMFKASGSMMPTKAKQAISY